MAFDYIGIDEAIERSGLRMVVVGGVPSPWGEAAKGLFHLKRLDWSAVRLAYDSERLLEWTGGQRSGPVAVFDREPPRAGWAEILLLAERLAPAPALLPADPAERALAIGLAHEICGEQGLSWSRRLQLVQAGLEGQGGFAAKVARYLGKKYGGRPESVAAAPARVHSLLAMLASRLRAQQQRGSRYFVGSGLTAVDVYAATAIGLFKPLPQAQCAMDEGTRAAFETLDAETAAALDPVLVAHRDMMYAEHLELPLRL